MRKILFLFLTAFAVNAFAQQTNSSSTLAESLIEKEGKLTIGGYGHVDYNQQISKDTKYEGKMDVHRLVMLFAYKFNSKTSFVTEIEYEHVTEVYIEQAFVNHKFSDLLNFRAGLMLVPMGIINEYHEPNLFNGVERPTLDKYIVPSTWREIGAGITGRSNELSFKYQLYIMNGLIGYADGTKFKGSSPLRSGRQKGAESVFTSPNLSARVEYYGINGMKLGLSGYFGKSQTSLFENGIDKNDAAGNAMADSSIVGISMLGADFRLNKNGLQLRAQYNYGMASNTKQYNEFGGTDMGSAFSGYYAEAGYNVLNSGNSQTELIPFIRYENYNTHAKVEAPLTAKDANNISTITAGIGLKLAKGAVLKVDYQNIKSKADTDAKNMINMGVGVMF